MSQKLKTPSRRGVLVAGTAGAAAVAAPALLAGSAAAQGKALTLLNVSYDPTRELYKDINVAYAKYWKDKVGQDIVINQSHGGSLMASCSAARSAKPRPERMAASNWARASGSSCRTRT